MSHAQQDAVAKQVAEVMARTGLSPATAAVLLGLLIAGAWLAERMRWQRNPQHRAALSVYVFLWGCSAGIAAITSVMVLRALVTARIACLPGKGLRACGDAIMDASGVFLPSSNFISAYGSTGSYYFMLLVVASIAFMSWYGVFSAGRGVLDRWRCR